MNATPGARGVAVGLPLSRGWGSGSVAIEEIGSVPRVASAAGPDPVSGGYFRVLGVPLLQGREFSDTDQVGSIPVAIVNQAFARQFFPSGSAIGHRVKFSNSKDKDPWLTIVGIVGNVSRPTLFMGYSQQACVYRPLRQSPQGTLVVFVRRAGKIQGTEFGMASAVDAVDTNLPTPDVQTVDESLAWFMAEPQFRAQLFGVFAALALLLAAIGVYGVLAQSIVQRTHEIGIRVALGAGHYDILRLILGEGLKLVFAGILIGLAGALLLTRLLSSMLYGVETTDLFTFTSVSLLLTAVAVLACYVPARRAIKMNPLVALRCE